MKEREPTKIEKALAQYASVIAGAHLGPIAGALAKRFVLSEAKNPIGYDPVRECFYYKDTGEYI